MSLKKELMVFIVGSFLIYFGTLLALYLGQRKMIYYPAPTRQDRQAYNASDFDIVMLRTEDGLELEAWYKAPKKGKPVIVVFHGNASHMGGSAWKVRPYVDEGYGALLPAYRGYAGNPGKLGEQGFYKDGKASINWLLSEKGLKPNDIVILGESLGTGVAVEMAANEFPDVKAVILESPYTSFVALAKDKFYYYPFLNYLVRDKYKSIDKIKDVKAPLLIVHGQRDIVVPYKFGKTLFEAANEPKEMITLDKAGHNDLYMYGAAARISHFMAGLK